MNATTTIRSVHAVKHVFTVSCSLLTRDVILNWWISFHVHVIYVRLYLVWRIYTHCFVICGITPRGSYPRIPAADRERILRVANNGWNWCQLAEHLGVKYKTAYTWIWADAEGGRQKKLTDDQVDIVVAMIERDPALTLQQLSERTQQTFGVHDSKSTVHNYLERRLITLEKVHAIPATMNNDANKELRRQYVERISQYMRDGKTIICMDETNINLFCRRTRGQARAGDRAAMALPASMGPNVHVVCTV